MSDDQKRWEDWHFSHAPSGWRPRTLPGEWLCAPPRHWLLLSTPTAVSYDSICADAIICGRRENAKCTNTKPRAILSSPHRKGEANFAKREILNKMKWDAPLPKKKTKKQICKCFGHKSSRRVWQLSAHITSGAFSDDTEGCKISTYTLSRSRVLRLTGC